MAQFLSVILRGVYTLANSRTASEKSEIYLHMSRCNSAEALFKTASSSAAHALNVVGIDCLLNRSKGWAPVRDPLRRTYRIEWFREEVTLHKFAIEAAERLELRSQFYALGDDLNPHVMR